MNQTFTILIISGSPHANGCSAELLRRFTGEFTRIAAPCPVVPVIYHAFESGFAPCTDCRACRTFEGCANGDMDAFWHDFERADGIIIASPVYNMSFPAPVKVILDRMQRYYNARFFLDKRPPIPKFRPVVLLMSAGDPAETGAFAVSQLKRLFSVTNCQLIFQDIAAGTDAADHTALIASHENRLREGAAAFLSSLALDFTK